MIVLYIVTESQLFSLLVKETPNSRRLYSSFCVEYKKSNIRREKKSLVLTDKDLAIYDIVKDERIKNVVMIDNWDNVLVRIELIEMDTNTFDR